MWNLEKKGTNELIYKTEMELQRCRKQIYGYQELRGGGINWEIGIDIHTPVYKIDN